MACLSSSGRQSLSLVNGYRAFNCTNRHITHRFLYRILGQHRSFSNLNNSCSKISNIASTSTNLKSTVNASNYKDPRVISVFLANTDALLSLLLQKRTLHVLIGNQKNAVNTTVGYSIASNCFRKSFISTLVRYLQ